MKQLNQELKALGIVAENKFFEGLNHFNNLLLETNRRFNLIGSREEEKLVSRHIVDSLRPFLLFDHNNKKICDIGSGGGFPAIPLALLFPRHYFVLFESNQKKAAFLIRVKLECALENVEVINKRAEEYAHLEIYREKFDFITARGFAPLAILLEVALPFLKVQGHLLAWKGQNYHQELQEAQTTMKNLSAELTLFSESNEEKSSGVILKIRKNSTSDSKYPRAISVIKKRLSKDKQSAF